MSERQVPQPRLPARMHAVLLTGHGDVDRLQYRDDVPVPVPGCDELLIRVGAAGVNNTDINLRIGWYSKNGEPGEPRDDAGWTGDRVVLPLIQGADVCGHVVATGSGVAESRIGERVLVDPVLRARPRGAQIRTLYLGSDCHGAFADYVCVPAANAHRVDSPLSDVELASFPCSYSAAENMLTRAAVGHDETVFVTGASGGVGSAAVQLAVRRRARVIAMAGESKAAQVAALGASQVVTRDGDLLAALGKESVDVVIDMVGGRQFPALLEVLRPGGRYAVAGAIAGALVSLDLRTLYLKDLRLLGCTLLEPDVFVNLVRYIEAGEIRPVVARTYPLSAIAVAQRDFLEKRHTGKIVLVP